MIPTVRYREQFNGTRSGEGKRFLYHGAPQHNQGAADLTGSGVDRIGTETSRPLVSVVIVNTNELHHLRTCLPSVHKQTYPTFEVIVIDNSSTDGSVEFIREHFPEVRIIESSENLGYPGANNAGFEVARGEYFAVLNPDTVVDPVWLEELVSALESDPGAGLATSKILLMDDPTRINTCGNEISFTGLTYCRGVGDPRETYSQPSQVAAVSGAAFLIRRSVVEDIGPFDADFVSYLEETDLSLRAFLAGYSSIYVPGSTLLHNYSFRFGERKCFHIEKNRFYMLFKILSGRTLVSLVPLLLLTECLVWGYMLQKGRGHVRQKWLSYVWLWRNRSRIRNERLRTQRLRRVPDRQVLQLLSPRLPFDQVAGGIGGRLLDGVTNPVIAAVSKVSLRLAG